MKWRLLSLLLSLLMIGTASFIPSNQSKKEKITPFELEAHEKLWSDTDTLVWADFKGKPDKRSGHEAMTYASLKTQPIIFNEQQVQYELVAIFNKTESWTLSDSKELLVHEQIHFDIAELVIRKMRKKFMNHSFRSLDGVNSMINRTFSEAANEHVRLNEQYDKETNHSQIKEKQLLWEKRIKKELEALNDYSSILVTLSK